MSDDQFRAAKIALAYRAQNLTAVRGQIKCWYWCLHLRLFEALAEGETP